MSESAVSSGLSTAQKESIRLRCSTSRPPKWRAIAAKIGIDESTLRLWRQTRVYRAALLEAEEEKDEIEYAELTPDPAIKLLRKTIDHGLRSRRPTMTHNKACELWLKACADRQARRRAAFDAAENYDLVQKTLREMERDARNDPGEGRSARLTDRESSTRTANVFLMTIHPPRIEIGTSAAPNHHIRRTLRRKSRPNKKRFPRAACAHGKGEHMTMTADERAAEQEWRERTMPALARIMTDAAPIPVNKDWTTVEQWTAIQPSREELEEAQFRASLFEGVPHETGRKRVEEYERQKRTAQQLEAARRRSR